MAKAQSLAAKTGALSTATELKLPDSFMRPLEPVKAKFSAPYITFCHPKRTDEWNKIVAKYGQPNEGEMYLIEPTAITHMPTLKAGWMCHKQFWVTANPAGEILATSFDEMPHPYKEHIAAVIIVYLADRIVPANIEFRTTKCPAAKAMSDALAECQTQEWFTKSPQHAETSVCGQPFMRFYGDITLGATRTSKSSGLPYRPTATVIKPTGIPEWRLLKDFCEHEDTQKLLNDAAARFENRVEDIGKKLKK